MMLFAETFNPIQDRMDNGDPLEWLPAWRWTRVNDMWSLPNDGGLFGGITGAIRQLLNTGANMWYFASSWLWEITTELLKMAFTPRVLEAFAGQVDKNAATILKAVGFGGGNSSSLVITILIIGFLLAGWRALRDARQGIKTLLRTVIPIGLGFMLLAATAQQALVEEKGLAVEKCIAEYNRGLNAGANYTESAAAFCGSIQLVPGSLKWTHNVLKSFEAAAMGVIVNASERLSDIDDPGGGAYGCNTYIATLEGLYIRDSLAVPKDRRPRASELAIPIVISRLWEKTYLDFWGNGQFGQYSSRRGACFAAEVRNSAISPIEMQAVWDASCQSVLGFNSKSDETTRSATGEVREGEFGLPRTLQYCNPDKGRNGGYDKEDAKIAEAKFNPSSENNISHEWQSAHILWATCDWVTPDLSEAQADRSLTDAQIQSVADLVNYPSVEWRQNNSGNQHTIHLKKGNQGRVSTFDTAFIGVRNAGDGGKYLNAETCEHYMSGDPIDSGLANDGRTEPIALWSVRVTDRANIEPRDAAESRRNSFVATAQTASLHPSYEDLANVQTTVDAISGASWTQRLIYGVLSLAVAVFYAMALVGMSVGSLLAQFIVGLILSLLPALLVLMALPIKATQPLAKKAFKLLVTAYATHLVFLTILTIMIFLISILNKLVENLEVGGWVQAMLYAMIPLMALFGVNAITKQFGLKITSLKGAVSTTAGLAAASVRPSAGELGDYARRGVESARNKIDEVRAGHQQRQLPAGDGSAGLRTTPLLMRSGDSVAGAAGGGIFGGALASLGGAASTAFRGFGGRPASGSRGGAAAGAASSAAAAPTPKAVESPAPSGSHTSSGGATLESPQRQTVSGTSPADAPHQESSKPLPQDVGEPFSSDAEPSSATGGVESRTRTQPASVTGDPPDTQNATSASPTATGTALDMGRDDYEPPPSESGFRRGLKTSGGYAWRGVKAVATQEGRDKIADWRYRNRRKIKAGIVTAGVLAAAAGAGFVAPVAGTYLGYRLVKGYVRRKLGMASGAQKAQIDRDRQLARQQRIKDREKAKEEDLDSELPPDNETEEVASTNTPNDPSLGTPSEPLTEQVTTTQQPVTPVRTTPSSVLAPPTPSEPDRPATGWTQSSSGLWVNASAVAKEKKQAQRAPLTAGTRLPNTPSASETDQTPDTPPVPTTPIRTSLPTPQQEPDPSEKAPAPVVTESGTGAAITMAEGSRTLRDQKAKLAAASGRTTALRPRPVTPSPERQTPVVTQAPKTSTNDSERSVGEVAAAPSTSVKESPPSQIGMAEGAQYMHARRAELARAAELASSNAVNSPKRPSPPEPSVLRPSATLDTSAPLRPTPSTPKPQPVTPSPTSTPTRLVPPSSEGTP